MKYNNLNEIQQVKIPVLAEHDRYIVFYDILCYKYLQVFIKIILLFY